MRREAGRGGRRWMSRRRRSHNANSLPARRLTAWSRPRAMSRTIVEPRARLQCLPSGGGPSGALSRKELQHAVEQDRGCLAGRHGRGQERVRAGATQWDQLLRLGRARPRDLFLGVNVFFNGANDPLFSFEHTMGSASFALMPGGYPTPSLLTNNGFTGATTASSGSFSQRGLRCALAGFGTEVPGLDRADGANRFPDAVFDLTV